MQRHGYKLSDLEGMFPWEREVYLKMLIAKLKEDAENSQKQ
jgi:hypothetical protein